MFFRGSVHTGRGENACLPRIQQASLIAIPAVMAEDEADQ